MSKEDPPLIRAVKDKTPSRPHKNRHNLGVQYACNE